MSRKPYIPSVVYQSPSPGQKSCLKKPNDRKSVGKVVRRISFENSEEEQESRRQTYHGPIYAHERTERGSNFNLDCCPAFAEAKQRLAEEVENDPFQSIRIECESESPTVYEEIGRETETELMELANELAEIEEVGRLLQEENDEIETMQRFRDKNIERYSSCEPDKISFSEIVDKINEICGQPVKHRPDDETQTDVAAAMLHLEEKGLKMTSSPAKIFTNLFPVESDVVSLAGTNVEVAEGISIPMSRPMRIVAKGPPYEDAGMIDFIRTDKQFIVPHAPVSAPSSDLPQLLGATNSMIEANRSSSGSKAPNEFQVVLDAIPSARSAHIQMRGSQSPKWFLGYYAILPNKDGIQKYEKPWPVLEKAWKNAVPTRIKPRNNEPIVVGS